MTAAVFHALMFALNADADANACEPKRTRSTPTERSRTIRCGKECAQICARAHTHMDAHVGAYVVQVRIAETFLYVAIRY